MARITEAAARDAAARRERVQADLAAAGLDAAVLASEPNFAYVTGYDTASWAMTARPLAIVAHDGHWTAVIGSGEADALALACPWLEQLTYTDATPRLLDDRLVLADFAASAVTQIGRLLGGRGVRRLGVEASLPSASGLPYDSLELLATTLSVTLHDVGATMWRRRQRKTEFELARLADAGAALGRLYELFAERARPGMSERELHALVLASAGEARLDRVGFSIVIAGDHPGEGRPGDRRWEAGELLLLDTCVARDGYWADFCRHFAGAEPSAVQRDSYARLVTALAAGRAACRPGVTTADVARAIAAELPRADDGAELSIGRVGHGIGRDFTEPPSVAFADPTVLEPGMALTVEPSATYACGHLEAEEMLAIEPGGARRLSPPFPPLLPVLGG